MEAGAGRTEPATATELVQTADVFLGMHEYQLAQVYFQRALAAGAPESDVRVGLANTYLATGDTVRAEAQLDEVSKNVSDDELSYNFLLAKANALRQRRQNAQALTAFAQATEAAREDTTAELAMIQASGDEGLTGNHTVSFLSDYTLSPIFEDTTVYPLDAALDSVVPASSNNLPLPRSSIQSLWTGRLSTFTYKECPTPAVSFRCAIRGVRFHCRAPTQSSTGIPGRLQLQLCDQSLAALGAK